MKGDLFDFLVKYGWVFIVTFAAVGALAWFGVLPVFKVNAFDYCQKNVINDLKFDFEDFTIIDTHILVWDKRYVDNDLKMVACRVDFTICNPDFEQGVLCQEEIYVKEYYLGGENEATD